MLQKRVGLLEAELRRKEKELELLQEVAPGSSREAQVLRRKMRQSEEELATSRLKSKQLEEVRPLFHTNSIGYCVSVRLCHPYKLSDRYFSLSSSCKDHKATLLL